MLNSISWQDFLTCVCILIASYYLIAILLFYGAEIRALLRPKPESTLPTKSSMDHPSGPSIMGLALQDNDSGPAARTAISNAEQLAFGADDGQEEVPIVKSVAKTEDLVIGTIADVMQDIKAVLHAIADAGHSKDETASLFQTLLQRYPQLQGTTHQQAITQFICETAATCLPFELNTTEVNAWWYASK